MARYKLSPLAQEDIKAIRGYSNKRWGKEKTSVYLSNLRQRLCWLANNPQLGTIRDEVKEGYRSFLEGEHTIFYRIVGKNIEIIGIPHQRMDIQKRLSDN